MTSISCYYIHFNRNKINIVFIKYEKFFKILLGEKSIILSLSQFLSFDELFQTYIISLLLTKDTSKIDYNIINNKKYYGVSTIKYWKCLYLTSYYDMILLEKSVNRNPLNTCEPKRSTSIKKINKFMKSFYMYIDNNYIKNPYEVIKEYYIKEITPVICYADKYNKNEKKIEILLKL